MKQAWWDSASGESWLAESTKVLLFEGEVPLLCPGWVAVSMDELGFD